MEGVAPLTILNVAYPLLTVGPDSGGGAEQILYLIDKGLVQAGMRSIVVAARGSRTSGMLVPTPVTSQEITNLVREEAQGLHALAIKAVLAKEKVDLIHYHGLDFQEYFVPEPGIAQLATLHLPVDWYPSSIFSQPGLTMNCVSYTQAASAFKWRPLTVVPNGIAISEFHLADTKQEYLLWLGRVCPEKGVHVAVRVAHKLDQPLLIAGPVHRFAAHEAYFEKQVRPFLDGKRRYVGPVDLDRKAELLANARCLLVPSSVAETSSLVAMEAISSGTPVIGFRSGALPEIIQSGVTGFIVDTEEEMGQAVRRIGEISSTTCHAIAETRFSADRMVADYLDLYRSILSSSAVSG